MSVRNVASPELRQRAASFAERWASGQATLAELGASVGISTERARQLIYWHDPTLADRVREQRRQETERRREALRPEPRTPLRDICGTAARYAAGCHCAECREANRVRMVRDRNQRVEKGRRNPELIPHGTVGAYKNWGCQCEACTAVHSEACRQYKRRRKPA